MGTSLFTRLAAVVLLMVLSASALTIALNYAKFKQVMTAQERSLYAFVATDLARTIEGSMNLGLPLAALQTTQRLIDSKHGEDRGIVGVTVFDARGIDTFDTERFRIGAPVPATMMPPAGAGSWRISRGGLLGVGERIYNSFGQSAGGVVVRYDPDRLDAVMLSVLLVMATSGVYVLCAAAVIGIVAVWLATRSTRRWFLDSTARLEASIHAVADGSGRIGGSPFATAKRLRRRATDRKSGPGEQEPAEIRSDELIAIRAGGQSGKLPARDGRTPRRRSTDFTDDPPFVIATRRTMAALAAAEHDLVKIGGGGERTE